MRHLLLLVLAVSLVGVLTIPNVASYELSTQQETIPAGKLYYMHITLEKGDKIDFTLNVKGVSDNNIDLEFTDPYGVIVYGGSCETRCSGGFTANEVGIYRVEFVNLSDENKFIDFRSSITEKSPKCPEGFSYHPEDELCVNDRAIPKGGGCLIATAAFGSEMAPQVQFLRELRDNTVLQTESGTSFMAGFNQFYYSFSPYIADYERENPAFKETVKIALTPLLTSLTLLNYVDIDSESEMLGYGIGVILLNIGMYFVAPAVLIMVVRKRI